MDRTRKTSFLKYRSEEYRDIRYWVFRKGQLLQLYTAPVPNTDEIRFSFWEMNHATWELLEEACLEPFRISGRESFITCNYEKMKLFYLRYLFRDWSFAEELWFDEEGKLDEESFRKVIALHPVILHQLVERLFEYVVPEEELATMQKQAHLLFAKNQSVMNPHPMISLYCNLTEMWSKFGLNYFDLKQLPLYERNALRKVLSMENQIRAAEFKAAEAKNKSNINKGPRR